MATAILRRNLALAQQEGDNPGWCRHNQLLHPANAAKEASLPLRLLLQFTNPRL